MTGIFLLSLGAFSPILFDVFSTVLFDVFSAILLNSPALKPFSGTLAEISASAVMLKGGKSPGVEELSTCLFLLLETVIPPKAVS